MIPADWIPYHRTDDDELIGYLQPTANGDLLPVTLFGHPLADEGGEEWWAADVLEGLGLSYLADTWELRGDDGSWSRVVINECDRERIVVANADFAKLVDRPSEMYGDRVTLPVPTDRLRPRQ
ncbi:hypothetical protein ACQBAU_17795 [Propionibacteriaceae bacterium Y2011]